MKQKVKIDVVSDVVCPWCYIGKRRLERALDRLSDRFEFEIRYHPFELNPDVPAEGLNQREYLIRKFGGEDRYLELTGRVAEVAELEGLKFDYDNQKVMPNTRKLHALIRFAASKGLQVEFVEVLFNAYFVSAISLASDENVLMAAVEAGIAEDDVKQILQDEMLYAAIADAEQEIQKLGITGVPFFIVNEKFGISGAQSTETFEQAISEIGAKAKVDGESCEVGDKNC